jgi:hypothetical protein
MATKKASKPATPPQKPKTGAERTKKSELKK